MQEKRHFNWSRFIYVHIKFSYTYELLGQYLGDPNVRVEEGGVALPVQGPAHQHQLQDQPDNLQHASLHSQIPPFPL